RFSIFNPRSSTPRVGGLVAWRTRRRLAGAAGLGSLGSDRRISSSLRLCGRVAGPARSLLVWQPMAEATGDLRRSDFVPAASVGLMSSRLGGGICVGKACADHCFVWIVLCRLGNARAAQAFPGIQNQRAPWLLLFDSGSSIFEPWAELVGSFHARLS